MDTKKYRILNKTRENALSQGVALVDSTFEPLTVLRVMVEGLAHNESTGLWLTRVSDLPSVPRLAPFDVVYLDKNQSVVEASELLPAARLPRFCKPATTALILPFQTISASQTGLGDNLEFCSLEQPEEDKPSVPATEIAAAPAVEVRAEPEANLEPAGAAESAQAAAELMTPAAAEVTATAAQVEQQVQRGVAFDSDLAAETAKVLAAAFANHASNGFEPVPIQEAPEVDAPVSSEEIEAAATRQLAVEVNPASETITVAEAALEPLAVSDAEAMPHAGDPELELAQALNRALASVEFEFGLPHQTIDKETESLLAAAKEDVEAQELEPGVFASTGAAELLRSSRSRKRRPGRQPLPKTRKSRAGLRRTEPGRIHFAARQAKVLEESELPFLEPSEDAKSPAASPAAEVAKAEQASPVVPVPVPKWPVHLESMLERVIKPTEMGSVIEMPGTSAPATAPVQAPTWEDAERGTQSKDHPPAIGRFLRWLYPEVYKEERRGSVRWPAAGLVAYHIRGESMRKLDVRNISSTGIYVLTGDRWKRGDTVLLSLQKNGMPEQRVEHRVEIEADAVRFGRDGIGLTFALPAGMSLDLWERAIQGKATEGGADYIIKEFRLARAMGFLRRVCPPAVGHVQMMLEKEFSNVRVANAIKILLKTENLMAQDPGAEHLVAHPEVVVRILELGSWVDVDWIEDIWAGLLATACTPDGQDRSNLPFVEMLSQFAPIHLRILGIASAKVSRAENGLGLGDPEFCTAGELGKAMDLSNLTKILRTISELSEYGLLQKAIRSPSSPHDASAKTAVTPLGLQMFARCHGLREVVAPVAWPEVSMVITSPAYSEAANYMVARSAWTESQVARLGQGK